MNPYHSFVASFAQLFASGQSLLLGSVRHPHRKPSLTTEAPPVIIFSPHPDDECLIGGLALRLMREARLRIINVAVTQGSNSDRQQHRWQELKYAWNWLGFELKHTGPDGLEKTATTLLAGKAIANQPTSLAFICSYGSFHSAIPPMRSKDTTAQPIEIKRQDSVPANKVIAFFKNPFADLDKALIAPLKIEAALIMPVPGRANGWLTAICLFLFAAFFAIGPGVCVWLALSELMPTRIRSNGMSIALVINQAVSTTIAGTFLPTVGKYGYSTMFFAFAGCTVVYFITATFFLPETKGKTLEEIEEHFEGVKKLERSSAIQRN